MCVDSVKRVLTDSFFRSTIDKFPVSNEKSFSYFMSGQTEYQGQILAVKAMAIFPDGSNDSLFLVKKMTVYIIY